MLAEFVNRLVFLANRAQQPEVITSEALPELALVREGDRFTQLPIPPKRRSMTLVGLDDLIAAVKDPVLARAPEIHHGSGKVVVLFDRADRRDRATIELRESERFTAVRQMHGRGLAMKPRDAVKFLRFDLPRTASTVVQALARIDFTRKSSGASTTAHGKETLGRSVEAAVQQADQVPEQFFASVPVYSNPGFREFEASIEIGIYLDVESEVVTFRVLADELDKALNAAQSFIDKELAEQLPDVPRFHGSP